MQDITLSRPAVIDWDFSISHIRTTDIYCMTFTEGKKILLLSIQNSKEFHALRPQVATVVLA